jgi:hypothetical protein
MEQCLFKLQLPLIRYASKEYLKSNKILNISNENIIHKTDSKRNFSFFVLTCNVAGMNLENIKSMNLSELLFSEKCHKYFESGN